MKVIIAGAHGKIGRRLARLLGAREVHPVGLVALLDEPRSARLSLDLISGDAPIDEAVAALVGPAGQ